MSEETNQNETGSAEAAASTPSAPTAQLATPAQPAAPAEASVQTDFVGASESSHSAAQQPTPHTTAQPATSATTQPLPSQQVPPAPAAACQQPAVAQPAAAAQPAVTPQANSVGASESSHSTAQQPTQPTPNPVPPTYQQPAQPTCQQQPVQPVAAPAPLTQLSGGMKFGWFVIGVLVGIPGILIAWLANVDKFPQVKAEAVKFSAIGLVVWAVLWTLACLGFLSIVASVLSSLFGDFSSSYGMYY
jgi:hypothetical protein